MSQKIGQMGSWQYNTEDTPETPTSSQTFKLPGTISGPTPMDPRFNLVQIRGMKAPGSADMRSMDLIVPSKNEYEWSVSYVPMKRISAPKYDFRHFHNMVLNNSSSTTAGGAWTFATASTTEIQAFTIFKEIDNLQHRFSGCRINRMTVKGQIDQPVIMEAQGFATLSTFADLAHTDATSLRDATPYMWGDVAVFLDGALATFTTAFEYTINNEAEGAYSLGDKDPKKVQVSGRNVDVTVTRQYQDIAQYADAKNGTVKAITIRLGTNDASPVDVFFRDGKLESQPVPGELENLLVHQLKFFARTVSTS